MASTWQHLNEDQKAEREMASDARDANKAHIEASTWADIQRGKPNAARSLVNDLGDLIAQSDDVMERLIVNAAGMRKGDQLRGWYAEAVARDVEALVARAIDSYAFAAALEAN